MEKVTIRDKVYVGWTVEAAYEDETGTRVGPVNVMLGPDATDKEIEEEISRAYQPENEKT